MNELLTTVSKDKWKMIGTHKRAGVLAPLFYVYSKKSAGIGDFNDLKLLIDWCRKTGNSIFQLLPMNEVGPTNCPYDSISSFALEPIYVSLEHVPGAEKKAVKGAIARLKRLYPSVGGNVDYRVKDEKLRILRQIYIEERGDTAKALKDYMDENTYWVRDFSLFKVLKAEHNGKPWYEWAEEYKARNPAELKNFWKEHEEDIMFEIWVQWVLCGQFKGARTYAASKKIFMKGDLPILVSRDSADVWAHPEFFKLEYAAGAPPDMYCAKGQRWGMPTYNWDSQDSDGYKYLKEKLRYAENFYDILRIDHVVGLFRIWSIPYNEPLENEGLHGSFDPSDEAKWDAHGRAILSVMNESTEMLLCAEDLGVIPGICPKTLKEFGMPGNDVQRWMKDWKVKHDFLNPGGYRHISVAMLSTHDTTNWRAWWENEAGTVDEALFKRKCAERGIDYNRMKDQLFDAARSRHGRLRWKETVNSAGTLVSILGKRQEELADYIDTYENTFGEKEKLWKHLGMKGAMRERSDSGIAREAWNITLESRSVFSIEVLMDLLGLSDILEGDPYQYRINMPGTVNEMNWSITMPVSLEKLLAHKVTKDIKAMVAFSKRAV